MLKRKISEYLVSWFQSTQRKPLLIEGARQVGKTFIIKEFIRQHYSPDTAVIINLELQTDIASIFDGPIDIESIITQLRLRYPHLKWNNRRVVLFFDEIQSQPKAITALKAFTEDGRFDVIASGSLLGISYRLVSSFPVGYVDRVTLHSLDFEEFLWALKVDPIVLTSLRKIVFSGGMIPPLMHHQMMRYFIDYIVVGGMPEVVQNFVDSSDYRKILEQQQQILLDYRTDIAKYADGSEKLRVRQCFDSIPQQLAKEYKKFQYSTIEKRASKKKYGNAVEWLVDAGIVNQCFNLTAPQIPLSAFRREDSFKIYMHDTGLLIAMLGEPTQKLILSGELGLYKGAIYENIYAQMVASKNAPLHYFERNSTLEVDFIATLGVKVVGIEVKATSGRSKSLQSLLSNYGVTQGIRCTASPHIQLGDICQYPHYAFYFIDNIK